MPRSWVFRGAGPQQRAGIEAIATDMWPPYRRAIKEACPQATLVFDLFHIVAKYGREVIDRVRTDEANGSRLRAAAAS